MLGLNAARSDHIGGEMAYISFTEADVCWCQPFDGPQHPQCPMHGEKIDEDKSSSSVVRLVGGSLLGSKNSDLVPLAITDDRNQNPDYAAWQDI